MRSVFARSLFAASALAGALFLSAPVQAAPETQIIDVAHSTLDFTAASFLVDTEGTFKDWKGEVKLDRQDITKSSVDVTINANSIDTRIEKRDNHLRNADFLDTAKFPTITFKSTSITKNGEKAFNMVGDLTLHGVTKSITIPVTIDRLQDNFSRFRGEIGISRKEFGITYNSNLNPIEDTVKIQMVINIKKPDPAHK